jgi:hypothetical protein
MHIALMMEAVSTSEKSVRFYETSRPSIPLDSPPSSHSPIRRSTYLAEKESPSKLSNKTQTNTQCKFNTLNADLYVTKPS